MSSRSPSASPSSSRIVSLVVIAAGALIMVVAVFADSIGLSGGGDGFGWKQLIAAIAGLVVLLFGVAWFLRPLIGEEPDEVPE